MINVHKNNNKKNKQFNDWCSSLAAADPQNRNCIASLDYWLLLLLLAIIIIIITIIIIGMYLH